MFSSFRRYYHQQDVNNFYSKLQYEVSGYMSNPMESLDTNVLIRYCNLLVGTIAEQVILPKMIIIVPDNDLNQVLQTHSGWHFTRLW